MLSRVHIRVSVVNTFLQPEIARLRVSALHGLCVDIPRLSDHLPILIYISYITKFELCLSGDESPIERVAGILKYPNLCLDETRSASCKAVFLSSSLSTMEELIGNEL